jgi:ABC-2 type transport system ATP-binding protein
MIEIRRLSKRNRDGTLALDDISISVRAGESHCLVGSAESGRPTLIGVCLSAIRPTSGEVLIAGVDVVRRPVQARRLVAFAGSHASLYGSLTIRQNVEFFTRLAGVHNAAAPGVVENGLRWAGVPERHFDVTLRNVGSGTAVLAWFAIASVRDTPVVILADPTRGVSPRTRLAMQDCVADLRAQGKAILATTTDLAFASAFDRIGVFHAGRIVAERSSAEVMNQSLAQFALELGGQLPLDPNHS